MLKIINLKTLLLILIFAASAYAQESGLNTIKSGDYETISSCGIKLKVPDHFVLSDRFIGYFHSGTGSSIVITYTKSQKSKTLYSVFTDKALAEKNITVVSRDTLNLSNEIKGYLIVSNTNVVSNDTAKTITEYERLIFFTDTHDGSVCINANYPKSHSSLLFKVITDCLLSVKPIEINEEK